ncbi:UDP-N-acetylmuramoyl-L-alanyl-D-glutamate--2,6-diaminopimelate ligase [Candidatus Dependentiae bacterium]|nr:UDP-N-acetylmuramoyl-L-alanyl-D-glutamate--2,6-diaminopimelate ligase [Candidatus Dependentiae bacterium]
MKIPTIYPVTCHTRHVGPGSTFVAIDGFKRNGVSFLDEAVARGATTLVINRSLQGQIACPPGVSVCFVDDCRKELAGLSSVALGNPSKKLKIIGITGTKGKTSTTYIIEYLLRQVGYKTALLGSIRNKIVDDQVESTLTTPESDYLHVFFDQCVKRGVTHLVMEVSSHALALHRVFGIQFHVVGFTNLAPEHMDFHPTMEQYFATKTKIFSQVHPNGHVVINCDNEWGRRAASGVKNCVMFRKTDIELSIPSLMGEFNKYNAIMAYLVCRKLGLKEKEIREFLKKIPGIPGRLQLHVLKNGARAFVDFAHNPSSFEAVLQTLRSLSSHLIVLFGCGGDRDKKKRSAMGRLATQYGDIVIVTSDNPRDEDPMTIIRDICQGVTKDVICVPDRKEAIARVVTFSRPDSIVALLGKGHESYYLCGGECYRWSDFEEISQY